jgi:isochorismate pyruvate lyase
VSVSERSERVPPSLLTFKQTMSQPEATPAPPGLCETLDEIREGMDAIDHKIIDLIAERVGYVRAAAKFKTSVTAVAAPERVQAVLNTRRQWAEDAGLSGPVIEALYRDLVAYCISEEKRHWETLHS